MKTLLRSILAVAILAALVTFAAALAFSLVSSLHGTIVLDGDTVTLDGFEDWHATMAIAVVVALVVALFAVALGLLAAAVSVLLCMSPFLFAGWLVWRALRKPPAAPSGPGPVNAAA